MPSYGNAQELGYFLNDLGFYLPVSDNVDTKILADIYSRGSYGLENITRYKKLYKYEGNLGVEYNVQQRGDRDLNNFSETRTFFVNWRHAQDRKAHPYANFSADVNAGSTENFTNNLNASQNDYLRLGIGLEFDFLKSEEGDSKYPRAGALLTYHHALNASFSSAYSEFIFDTYAENIADAKWHFLTLGLYYIIN